MDIDSLYGVYCSQIDLSCHGQNNYDDDCHYDSDYDCHVDGYDDDYSEHCDDDDYWPSDD